MCEMALKTSHLASNELTPPPPLYIFFYSQDGSFVEGKQASRIPNTCGCCLHQHRFFPHFVIFVVAFIKVAPCLTDLIAFSVHQMAAYRETAFSTGQYQQGGSALQQSNHGGQTFMMNAQYH